MGLDQSLVGAAANFEDSTIDILPQLYKDPTLPWKQVRFQVEIGESVPDLETRVIGLEMAPDVAGVDIEYFPF